MSVDYLKQLWAINERIASRINEIAKMEASAAVVGGVAAEGVFWDEKLRLLERSDEVLSEIERVLKDGSNSD